MAFVSRRPGTGRPRAASSAAGSPVQVGQHRQPRRGRGRPGPRAESSGRNRSPPSSTITGRSAASGRVGLCVGGRDHRPPAPLVGGEPRPGGSLSGADDELRRVRLGGRSPSSRTGRTPGRRPPAAAAELPLSSPARRRPPRTGTPCRRRSRARPDHRSTGTPAPRSPPQHPRHRPHPVVHLDGQQRARGCSGARAFDSRATNRASAAPRPPVVPHGRAPVVAA